jgi:hypothetical protein
MQLPAGLFAHASGVMKAEFQCCSDQLSSKQQLSLLELIVCRQLAGGDVNLPPVHLSVEP